MIAQGYEIVGANFQATEFAVGAFQHFKEGMAQANDLAPWGMVEELKLFSKAIHDQKILVDVGALFGLFSLVFTGRPGTKAYAIEASPWAFEVLQEQVELNPERNIEPYLAFAGSRAGEIITCGRDWYHVIAGLRAEEGVSTAITRLDDIIPECDTIKIDTEGYEEEVLKGADRLLRKYHPMLFIETHWSEVGKFGGTTESLINRLKSYDYTIKDLMGADVEVLNGGMSTRIVCT